MYVIFTDEHSKLLSLPVKIEVGMRNVIRKNITTLRKGTKTVPLGALFDCPAYDGWAGSCIVLQKLLMVTKDSKAAKRPQFIFQGQPNPRNKHFFLFLWPLSMNKRNT